MCHFSREFQIGSWIGSLALHCEGAHRDWGVGREQNGWHLPSWSRWSAGIVKLATKAGWCGVSAVGITELPFCLFFTPSRVQQAAIHQVLTCLRYVKG